MKIEILKVENGKIVEPEDLGMEICMMGGCGGGGMSGCGGGFVCATYSLPGCSADANVK